MKITLKQIAKELNVSPTTVSKALQDYPDIGTATKKRIKQFVEKVGYRPNLQAAFLRTQKTKLVGLIVPDLKNYLFSEILEEATREAEKNGYLLIVLQSNNSQEKEKELVDRLLQQQVDGIFISLTRNTTNFDHLNKIIINKTSLILFNNVAKAFKCNKIVFNDRKAAFQATETLIKNGYKKIIFFRESLVSQKSIDQFIGYRNALEKYKIPVENKYILTSEEKIENETYSFIASLFATKEKIEGLFIPNHKIYFEVMRFFTEQNIASLNRIKIISFNTLSHKNWDSSNLNLIKLNGSKMGRKIISTFLQEQSLMKNKSSLSFVTKTLEAKVP